MGGWWKFWNCWNVKRVPLTFLIGLVSHCKCCTRLVNAILLGPPTSISKSRNYLTRITEKSPSFYSIGWSHFGESHEFHAYSRSGWVLLFKKYTLHEKDWGPGILALHSLQPPAIQLELNYWAYNEVFLQILVSNRRCDLFCSYCGKSWCFHSNHNREHLSKSSMQRHGKFWIV